MPTSMIVDVTETTKAKYYAARDEKFIVAQTPMGFVRRDNDDAPFIMWLTHGGKFYTGDLVVYLPKDFKEMLFREVQVSMLAVFDTPKPVTTKAA